MPDETWDEVIQIMIDGLKKGHEGLGLAAAIERCGEILTEFFPTADDDVNELRDHLVIKE